MLKIGILGHGFINWNGGLDLLRLISNSLIAYSSSVELSFIVPTCGPYYNTKETLLNIRKFILDYLKIPHVKTKSLDIERIYETIQNIEKKVNICFIDLNMSALRKASRDMQLDIMLPAIKVFHNQSIPWIGYLPDFQHMYYPDLFTRHELLRRDQQFMAMLQNAGHIFVNSKAVAEDIICFSNNHRAKVTVMPFCASPHLSWLTSVPINPLKYGITRPYFIISNQFWKHKDHLTAWKAFSSLLSQYPEVQLVCTGELKDYRHPDYFLYLQQAAERLGILDKLKILGLIPKVDQIDLMKQSVALIQPSLFEGGPGGGSVFDAISLGIPSIVSNIKVNCELDDSTVTFFDVGSEESLASKMLELLESYESRTLLSADELLIRGLERQKHCGKVLMEAINFELSVATQA
jgi:glycosyltransferase involved in cell wall biosynthesis